MSHCWHNTICVLSNDENVLNNTKMFAEHNKMKFFRADIETDLIAVPYCMALIDASLLKGEFADYIKEAGFVDEKIISHTKSEEDLSSFISFEENMSFKYLQQKFGSYIQEVNRNENNITDDSK